MTTEKEHNSFSTEKEFHEVEYQYIWHVMETPIQTLVNFSENVAITVDIMNNISEQLNIAEEYVHPLIDKKELKSET